MARKEMIEIINKAKSWFFRKINKIDKSLLDWWRKNSERAHNDNYSHRNEGDYHARFYRY